MPTLTQASPVRHDRLNPIIPSDLEEAEYPPELYEELDREFELAKSQIAAGELRPTTTAEIAAKFGLYSNSVSN